MFCSHVSRFLVFQFLIPCSSCAYPSIVLRTKLLSRFKFQFPYFPLLYSFHTSRRDIIHSDWWFLFENGVILSDEILCYFLYITWELGKMINRSWKISNWYVEKFCMFFIRSNYTRSEKCLNFCFPNSSIITSVGSPQRYVIFPISSLMSVSFLFLWASTWFITSPLNWAVHWIFFLKFHRVFFHQLKKMKIRWFRKLFQDEIVYFWTCHCQHSSSLPNILGLLKKSASKNKLVSAHLFYGVL